MSPRSQLSSLPPELLDLILLWTTRHSLYHKNQILPLRRVSKAWNTALSPYVLKTLQLEFSRFLKKGQTDGRFEALKDIGGYCKAVYLDMMVVRDEEEISRLGNVFRGMLQKVPEMAPLLDSLRKYCLSDVTFDEADFMSVVKSVMDNTPNMTRLKVNLPFQVVGHGSSTATLFLATTLACVAKRSEETKLLETFVLDHVSDTTIMSICHNPVDTSNAFDAFANLKNLILSVKRQEKLLTRQKTFGWNLWLLIRKAVVLESLCLIGWNVKRDIKTRRHWHDVNMTEWNMRSLPYPMETPLEGFPRLKYLELKRVDMLPECLLKLIEENAATLKEIYLYEVYLKVREPADNMETCLWIGRNYKKPEDTIWVADELRRLREGPLKLDILRVTGIGYDDYEPARSRVNPNYDLVDPTGLQRSFDQRFVEAVFGNDDIVMEDVVNGMEKRLPPILYLANPFNAPPQFGDLPPLSEMMSSTPRAINLVMPPQTVRELSEYDAETYQKERNTTSLMKRCIDGHFFNHNEQALRELQRIITVADRGMHLISEELARAHEVAVENWPVTGPAGTG